MLKTIKQNKLVLITIGIATLLGLIILWLTLAYAFSILSGSKWLKIWNFLWPIIIWIFAFPIYVLYFGLKAKTSKKKNTSLATSRWMELNIFKKKFKKYNLEKDFNSGYLMKSKIKKGKFNFRLSNEEGHATIIGSTGSGKTSRLVNPNVYIFANSHDKPSMILSDPKGELFNTNSKMLQDKGYEVLSINLRNRKKSSFWNPLEKLWDLWNKKAKDKIQQELNREEALSYLSELASVLFPDEATGGDKFWNSGANTIFRFFTIAFLELADKNKEFKKEHFNIANILRNIQQTSYDELQELITKLPKGSYAIAAGGRNIKSAEQTAAGLISNCVTTLQIYADPIIKRITSKTNLKINPEKPQAIFIIVPDETKAKYPFISLFVSETYKELIALASKSKGSKLSRKFYYILDEFGNIPKMPAMDSMITVARSRNIFFMLFLQNYSQLNEKYGNNTANTIISNCMYEYFLLTSDFDTATKFSKKLGERELTTRSRSYSKNDKGESSSSSASERTRNLIHPDELMKLQMGEMIISLAREKPIKSQIGRFWEYEGFKTGQVVQKENSDYEYEKNHTKIYAIDENKKIEDEKLEEELSDIMESIANIDENKEEKNEQTI